LLSAIIHCFQSNFLEDIYCCWWIYDLSTLRIEVYTYFIYIITKKEWQFPIMNIFNMFLS
jgi:hypothetical protein